MYTEADAKRAMDRLEALEKQVAQYKDRTANLEQRVAKLEATKKPADGDPVGYLLFLLPAFEAAFHITRFRLRG